MKLTKQIFLSLFLVLLITSCTDDDSNDDTNDQPDTQENPLSGDFFPSNGINEWNYDVENIDNTNNETTNTSDRVFLETPNSSIFSLDVNDDGISNGTMSGILTNGTLSKTDVTLSTTGELTFELDGLDDINIPYTDAVLYNLNAPDGSELSSFDGAFTQTIQSFPVTITYTLSTKQDKNWSTIEIDGQDYSEVTQSSFILTMKIDVTLPVVGDSPVANEQESLVITSYFGKGIGLIKSTANTTIVLNSNTISILEQLGVDTADIPNDISTENTQVITDFTIN